MYYSLPIDRTFFKLEGTDDVLMPDMQVLPLLYPMQFSKLKGTIPRLKIVMQANLTPLDYILGE
jgi:hypothetical protein